MRRSDVTVTRPAVRYHGGKFMLAPWIISHMPAHSHYVEPCAGGASVLLRKGRCFQEVYNDLDGEMFELFEVIRDRGDELARAVELTLFSRVEFERAWSPAKDPLERARRALVRSYMGHGGAAITESRPNGRRMTSFRSVSRKKGKNAAMDWRSYPAALVAVIERMQGVFIENLPACEAMRRFDGAGTCFYVDPPYPKKARGDEDADYRVEMTDQDHCDLAAVAHAVRGKVLISGYHCELYDDLYKEWRRVEKQTFADGALPRTEVLWMNFQPEGLLL
jgi:DNA adenine methylase